MAFLGFIAIFILTACLKAAGLYKHFVILSIILIVIAEACNMGTLSIYAGTVLIGSFFISLFWGAGNGEVAEPHSRVDLSE